MSRLLHLLLLMLLFECSEASLNRGILRGRQQMPGRQFCANDCEEK